MSKTIQLNKGKTMSGIKRFVNKRQEKSVEFMGEEVTIYKLTLGQARQLQNASAALAEAIEKGEEAGDAELGMLREVLKHGVEGGDELTAEDFETFSADDLSKLATEIMIFAGLQTRGNLNEEDSQPKS
jgi:flagellar biosynthesis/type III secretory pathway protein FliH